MQVVLVMFRAEGEKRSFSITRDVTVVGRREDCDLRIPVSEVSRKHCRFIKDGDALRVEDLGSSNGTYHNGQRVSGSVTLDPGDSVQVGPVVFVVQINGAPPDDELAPFSDRAAHHLGDATGEQALEVGANGGNGAENIELLEESSDSGPLPMTPGDTGEPELVLDENAVLSEDELLMDMNSGNQVHEKH